MKVKEIRVRPFFGPVGPPDKQNPSAHGNVCVLEERVSDGARRWRNVNGTHVEFGYWFKPDDPSFKEMT